MLETHGENLKSKLDPVKVVIYFISFKVLTTPHLFKVIYFL
jgi:hypothetical protein